MLQDQLIRAAILWRPLVLASLLLGGAVAALAQDGRSPPTQPRLILQITVDALRGDLPRRFAHVLGEGGLRYLMDQGVDYTNANYLHANTETIVGHTSLATGSVPAAHGMVGNVWFDREQGRLTYNIEDARHHLLTAGADIDRKT
ncbi:MAG: alkaline phosphatase family protein, partial [Rubrivivax sp.]|nr:alkaline phosphatase family protein [Rubrivivax sp.]